MIHSNQPITRHTLREENFHAMMHDAHARIAAGDQSEGTIYTQFEPYTSVWCWDAGRSWSTAIPNPVLPEAISLALVGRPIWEAVQIESLRHHPWARSLITHVSSPLRQDQSQRIFIRIRSTLPE